MSVIKGSTDIALIDTFDDVENNGDGEINDEDEQILKRKKVEVTLGKVFSGADAVRRSRSEKYHPSNPSQLLRAEFLHSMQSVPIPGLLQLYEEQQRQSTLTNIEQSSILSNLDVWGLPPLLLARYKQYAKITSLFQWQVDCLLSEDGLILQGQKNFVYCAPTSGGKTLIAELLILRKLSQTMRLGDPKSMNHQRKTIFFVVPFIALAEEKTNYFRQLWQDMNLAIKTFHTDDDLSYNHHQLGEDVELVICTIERANILLTQLLDEKRENQISMIVIDEIHLLSDPHRGFLLEVLLTKILYLLKDQVQIIGMSATLPNIRELATWLQAALYVTSYRPVVLDLLVARDMTVYKVIKDFDVPKPSPQSLFQPTSFDGEHMMIVEDTNSNDSLPRKFMEGISVPLSSSTSSSEVLSPPNVRYEDLGRISILVKDDLDGFKSLCVQTMLEEDKSALVFCNSKKRCEVCASAIVASIKEYYQTLSASKLTPHSYSSINPPYSTLKVENSRYQSVPRQGKGNLPTSSDIPYKPSVPLNKRQNPPSYSHGTWVPSNPRHQAVSMNHDALFQSKHQQLFFQRRHLLEELKQVTPIGLCTVLQECLPYGVAYHHAGLSNDERAVIEKGFRTGLIQILCTTSTLSAGVNLPAHKVIIRSLQMGDRYLSVASFRQMCGRAGRTGLDSNGEAIIMLGNKVSKKDRDHCEYLLTAELEPLRSSLHLGQGGGIEKLLLEMITCGRLTQESNVMEFIQCTLMYTQLSQEEVLKYVKDAIIFLKKEQFILFSPNRLMLLPSPLGRATTLSGITPKDTIHILPLLLQAKRQLYALNTSFHLIFLIIPVSSLYSLFWEPDWSTYEQFFVVFIKEYPELQVFTEAINLQLSQMISFRFHRPQMPSSSSTTTTSSSSVYLLYKRFYLTMILFLFIQDTPLTSSSSSSALARYLSNYSHGQLQQLIKDVIISCQMLIIFCQKCNWMALVYCLQDVQKKVINCSQGGPLGRLSQEVLALVKIGPEMTAARARYFHEKYQISNAMDMLALGEKKIADILVEMMPFFHDKNVFQEREKVMEGEKGSDNGHMRSIMRDRLYETSIKTAKQIIDRCKQAMRDEIERKEKRFDS